MIEKPKLSVVICTAFRAITTEPKLVLGILGALVQVLIGMIGRVVTTLAVQYSY